MSSYLSLPPAERLACILDGLCKAVAARGPGGFLPIPLLVLVWTRIRQASGRIVRLAARAEAGTLPAVPRAPRAAPASPTPRKPQRRLPCRAGWLIGPVPEAGGYASQLRHLLAQPDMAALLEAAPGIERLLRPLCRMLGVERPPLPPRPTSPPTSPIPPRQPPPAEPAAASAAPPAADISRIRPRPARAPPAAARRTARPHPA